MSLQIGFKYFPFNEIYLNPTFFNNNIKNLKIIQLSDMHLGAKTELNYLQVLVQKINDLVPDIILITGDIIQAHPSKLVQHLKTFSDFQAPVYYVTGNHDIYYGASILKKYLAMNNVICLDNKVMQIKLKDNYIQLIGLSDRYSFIKGIKRPIKELFLQLDKNIFTILLAHQPKDVSYIKSNRVDMQLSGHTHGGQVFPLNYIVRLFQPYFKGLYTYKKTLLYVTKGLGYWGINIRYRVKSEIPVFIINANTV